MYIPLSIHLIRQILTICGIEEYYTQKQLAVHHLSFIHLCDHFRLAVATFLSLTASTRTAETSLRHYELSIIVFRFIQIQTAKQVNQAEALTANH